MKWFSAHIVMAVKLKGKIQSRFPVWENIVLISAKSEHEAFASAEAYGRLDEGDDDTFRWGGQPAQWVFAGIRKLTEVALVDEMPSDGTEVSYNELELDSQEAVRQFVAGRPTAVKYNDRYRPIKKTKQAEHSRKARRRLA